MKPSPKAIAVLIVIIFLLILSIVVIYSNLIKKQANKIQSALKPIPTISVSTPLASPLPVAGSIIIDEPLSREIDIIMGDEYEIKGTNSLGVEFIDLEINNDRDVVSKRIVPLDSFREGNQEWSFNFEANNDFLTEGKNVIDIIARYKNGTIQKEKIVINAGWPRVESEVVRVNWYSKLIEQPTESTKCWAGECELNVFKAGVVEKGTYKDLTVYLGTSDGFMSSYSAIHYVVKDGKKIYFEDNGITMEGYFDFPEIILSPDNNYSLSLYPFNRFINFFQDLKNTKIIFKDDYLGNVYFSDKVCEFAFIERPDHTTASYFLTIPFRGTGTDGESDVLEVTFIGNKKNTDQYNGLDCIHNFKALSEDELAPDKRLKISGTASNGDYLCEFIDQNAPELLELYNDKSTSAYDPFDSDKNKYTYQEFLDLHPILFWKDPFGRWLRFINMRVDYVIELGKPVIYLYPEEKTRLSVKVAPNGGFIVTDPPYGDGWEVEAEPNGQITDLKTGKKYDYLFWEGVGLNYPMKNIGWVVKKEELEKFFVERLSILGLSENEIVEFNEYWVKKLSKMPYYKIYFLTQNEFNEIAPLITSPQAPQTLIRVMMTAEGLMQSEKIPEQKLPATPVRKGFTVVEWGGVLLR